MKPRENIKNALSARRQDILALIERMVNLNSYSHNKAGIDKVGGIVRTEMS